MSRKIILIISCLLLVSVSTYAQLSIIGKVTDANSGQGIPGVSIKVNVHQPEQVQILMELLL